MSVVDAPTGGGTPAGSDASPDLPPHYYRDNFLRLCDTVEAQYANLLAPQELGFLSTFRALDFPAQCLYVRLVSRVGPWFRESKLAYPEIDRLGAALDQLLARGLLLAADALSPEDLGGLFTVAELRGAFGDLLPAPRPAGKQALLEAIEALGLDERALLVQLSDVEPGRVVAPLALEQVELLQLLFFGNRYQGLTEFVLSDLGVARYYPYALDRAQRLFPDRPALEEYLACAALGDAWYEASEMGETDALPALADELLTWDIVHPSSERRWHRLCNSAARDLERLGETTRAFELYGRSRRHPARERRARLLERRGDWGAAAALCEAILAAPWCEEEGEAAGRILPRVRRKLGGGAGARRRDRFEEIALQLVPGEGGVEQQVAEYLAPAWPTVRYVENSLMNALFGLAFWEQIFAPLPGVFHNPYQSVPADMYEAGFRERREQAIGRRLERLRQADLARELPAAFDRYRDYQCRWVDWRRVDRELVAAAARVIPAEHLLAIWERILFDPRDNRRGFPDLVALGGEPGRYCLIEVKGPGDALQDSQRRWLRFFGNRGIPAQVAWVTWRDD